MNETKNLSAKDELVRKGILHGATAFTGPYGVQIGIIDACNYNCQFCGRFSHLKPPDSEPDKKPVKFSQEAFQSLTGSIISLEVEQVSIVGVGEPFLHGGLISFIKAIKERGIRCMVTTNGSLLKTTAIDKLIESRLDILNVSINAGAQDTYEKIHGKGAGNRFRQVLDNLRVLTKVRPKGKNPWLNMRYVITRSNLGELGMFIDHAISAGADEITFQHCVAPDFDPGQALNDDEKMGVATDLEENREKIISSGMVSNVDFFIACYAGADNPDAMFMGVLVGENYYNDNPCLSGWTYAMILENGDVHPCCYCGASMGNINEDSFTDIWYGEKYNSFREKAMRLAENRKDIEGCRCFSGCGSVKDNIRTGKRLNLS